MVETRKNEAGVEFLVIPIRELVDVLKDDVDQLVHATAVMMEETALMQALVMIHGPDRAAERYVAAGGHLRFMGDDVVILWPKGGMRDAPEHSG